MAKRLLFNAFVLSAPTHNSPGLWRHPDAQQLRFNELELWADLAKKLEAACFDALFFAEVLGLYGPFKGGWDIHVKDGLRFPVNDALVLAAALAGVTEHIGLAFTASIIQDHPFTLARRVATLDHLSKGRAAWNIVTSSLENAHRNYGETGIVQHDERYKWAEEYVDVVFKLLEGSWEDDAVIGDRTTGVFADRAKIHRIDHIGERYSVQGPAITSPSPQRLPYLFQAGSSPAGRHFAAKYAEAQFIAGGGVEIARQVIQSVRQLAVSYGRHPDDVKFFQGLFFVVASTEEEARRKNDDYLHFLNFDTIAAEAGGNIGIDLSQIELDEPIDYHGKQGGLGPILALAATLPGGVVTKRQYLTARAMSSTLVGTPEAIADRLEEWQAAGVDGVNVMNRLLPGSYTDFIEHVMPELRRRGLAQGEYRPGTLREKLGGSGPRVNERHPAALYRGHFTQPL
jgi:long-chain alkane monooxygenase